MRNTKFAVALAASVALVAAPLFTAATASAASGTNGPAGSATVSGGDYVAGTTTESAKFKKYGNPSGKYKKASCAFDLSGLSNGTPYTSITGCGGNTADISIELIKAKVPDMGWLTWSPAPFSEDSAPHVLADYNGISNATITFDKKSKTGGVEVEPNDFGTWSYTVAFYAGADGSGKKLGEITRDVTGDSGARLFGAKSKKAFKSLVITGDPGSLGFAIAQIRSAK